MSSTNLARPNVRTIVARTPHKLNFELDTSVSVFNWLPEGKWLRGLELEGSLDYVATGLPKAAIASMAGASSTEPVPGRSRSC